MHGSPPHEIKYGAIGSADSGVANTWEAASDAWQGCPYHAVGVPVMRSVDCHIHFEFGLHLLLFHILYIQFINTQLSHYAYTLR